MSDAPAMSADEPIAFIDLQAQRRRLGERIDEAIARVLDHGQFIMGPEVSELEDALARFSGCRYAISVSSGTDALLIALMAEGVGPGDGIFVPSFTFTASAEVIVMTGARPIFIDVEEHSFNIDPKDLQHRVAETRRKGIARPRAVMAVDLFGRPADYSAIQEIAKREGLFVLADAAQSFGGALGGRRVGNLAPATAVSFFPAKPLGAYGDGGAILTNDATRAEVMRSIRQHGKGSGKYDVVRTGVNGRLDTLQAAILLAKLEVFSDEINARGRIANTYTRELDGLVVTPRLDRNAVSAWAQYSILSDKRDNIAAALKENGIPSAVYYPRPMHLQPAYQAYSDGPGTLPVSEALCEQILSIPMHPYLSDESIKRIKEVISSVAQA